MVRVVQPGYEAEPQVEPAVCIIDRIDLHRPKAELLREAI